MSDASALKPFHLSIPVDDLISAKEFYTVLLPCKMGRKSAEWMDFDLFGHQITAHLKPEEAESTKGSECFVNNKEVPVRHFGIVLPWMEWEALANRLSIQNAYFLVEPCTQFVGMVREQAIMFLTDPSGNVIEFKAYRNPDQLFAP